MPQSNAVRLDPAEYFMLSVPQKWNTCTISQILFWIEGIRSVSTDVYSFLGMSEVCTIKSFCRNHSGQSWPSCLLFGAAEQLKLDEMKLVCIINSHGFILGSEVMPNRLVSIGRLARLRIGSLRVSRFGMLVLSPLFSSRRHVWLHRGTVLLSRPLVDPHGPERETTRARQRVVQGRAKLLAVKDLLDQVNVCWW